MAHQRVQQQCAGAAVGVVLTHPLPSWPAGWGTLVQGKTHPAHTEKQAHVLISVEHQ
jgi:hypothetical protein